MGENFGGDCPPALRSVLLPGAKGGTEVAPLVFHGEAVLRGHVQLLVGHLVEL